MSQSLRLILMPDGSMERLCILSEKTPSNLKTSENGWREKYQSCVLWHKFSIHFRLTTNPMVWKSFLVHKLSIHRWLVVKSDGKEMVCLAQTLHPLPACLQVRWRVQARPPKKAPSILELNQVRWRVHTRMP